LVAAEVAQLFTFLLSWEERELDAWLAEQWTPQALALVAEDLTDAKGQQLVRAAELFPAPWPEGFATRALISAKELGEGRSLQRTATACVRSGREVELREWAQFSGDTSVDPLLVALGDPEAEGRLIRDLADANQNLRRHSYEVRWLDDVRHASSADLLFKLLRDSLREEKAIHDLSAVTSALTRCAGNAVIRYWDELIRDPKIPGASFLYYPRRDAIDALVTQQPPLTDLREISPIALGLVPSYRGHN
jgi:hypothetical protein